MPVLCPQFSLSCFSLVLVLGTLTFPSQPAYREADGSPKGPAASESSDSPEDSASPPAPATSAQPIVLVRRLLERNANPNFRVCEERGIYINYAKGVLPKSSHSRNVEPETYVDLLSVRRYLQSSLGDVAHPMLLLIAVAKMRRTQPSPTALA